MRRADTIYALATPPGKSGVAIFRISGPLAATVAASLGHASPLAPRLATLAELRAADGTPLDQALLLWFPAPHSFTGDGVLEIHCHGSMAVMRALLAELAAIDGLRLAEAGEFSRRAFLNGKLDLAQAEGLADLIDAETASQHRQAMRQLGGEMSRRVAALREQVLTPLALLEAYIDFPDEEIPDSVLAETENAIDQLRAELNALLDDGGVGEAIRHGFEIVIIGPPNAGKSTLLNALAKRDVAIVSPHAGTTRDLLEVHLDLGGYAVTLVDTAGLRDAAEHAIEAEGMRRARARAAEADLILLCLDHRRASEDIGIYQNELANGAQLILTQCDTGKPAAMQGLPISAKTGEGIAALIERLRQHMEARVAQHAAPLITQGRHREALAAAERTLAGWSPELPLELGCEVLRRTATELGKITGKIWVDDVLDLVFRRFCIGK